MGWTTTDLVASVKRRAGVPAAQAAFTTAEILDIADEEIQSYLVPLVMREREDYWVTPYDVTLVNGTVTYRLPYRAVGGKLRKTYLLDVNGRMIDFPRIPLTDLQGVSYGYWIEGNVLNLINDGTLAITALGVTLRMYVSLRPNALVQTSAAATVSTFNATAKTITISTPPGTYTGQTSWDIIRAKPGFETLAFDQAGTLAGSTITFSASLPADLAVGDYVCLPEQTPVPQVPAELHNLLAQRVAVAILKDKGMADKAAIAESEMKTLQAAGVDLITPRSDGDPIKFVNRRSLFRIRW